MGEAVPSDQDLAERINALNSLAMMASAAGIQVTYTNVDYRVIGHVERTEILTPSIRKVL